MYVDFKSFDLLINTEGCTLADEVSLIYGLFEQGGDSMKVAYISDIQISSLVGEETWLNESFDYFSSIFTQFVSRYSDTIDYLILNGGIYSDTVRFLEFV